MLKVAEKLKFRDFRLTFICNASVQEWKYSDY